MLRNKLKILKKIQVKDNALKMNEKNIGNIL